MSNKKEDVYGDHTSHQFNDELIALKNDFLEMGGLVESQLDCAIKALVVGDDHMAEDVRVTDKKVDQMELELDEEATQILARRQPTARDLRLVVAVIKMVSDLERIGDESKKVAKFAIKISEEGRPPRGYVEVLHIGEHVLHMLHDALDAFARLDADRALRIMKEDKLVDEENKAAMRVLLTFMMEDARNISWCMSVMWILRALERVGDHACNISENIIYMVEGRDVRHTSLEEAEKVVAR